MSTEVQPTMAKAYVFGNGMVIAFDQFGQQMPDYQGPLAEVQDKIRADYPHVEIRGGEMSRAQIVEHLLSEGVTG
jgi:hypothetical protein